MTSRAMTFLAVCLVATASHGFSSSELWEAWPQERFVSAAAPCLRHAELQEQLDALADRYPAQLTLEEVGRSFQGKSIRMMSVGAGERKVFLWSQMHGDEPSATPALLDLAQFLLAHADDPGPRSILGELTLIMIPMVNPDGAELYVRRNAQAIDINRDALNLATPEGRILKEVRDKHQPILGFNLHDQNRRKAVGDTGVLSTNSVLAVAGDPEGTVTPGRMRAKRACSAIVEALAPFMPGGMARFDEDWSPRAFGDNITAWGTPVVLIETGGLPPGGEMIDLTRLNFVALLTVLQDLAKDDLARYDPEVYEELPRTQNNSWAEVVVRNGYLLQPGTTTPYRSDLSFYLLQSDRQRAGCAADDRSGSMIFEVGDNRFIGYGQEIDSPDTLLVAPFTIGARGWPARKWLVGETLARLSDLGVGTVRWSVSNRRISSAEGLASQLNERGHTRVVVLPGGAALPPIVLGTAPGESRPTTLQDLLAGLGALEAGTGARETEPATALQRLWPDGSSETLPTLRPGQSASFLILGPAPDGQIDLEKTALLAVWLDGIEVRRVE